MFFVPRQPPPYTGVTAASSLFTGPPGSVKATMTSTCPCLFTSAGGQEACAQVNVEARPVAKAAAALGPSYAALRARLIFLTQHSLRA